MKSWVRRFSDGAVAFPAPSSFPGCGGVGDARAPDENGKASRNAFNFAVERCTCDMPQSFFSVNSVKFSDTDA